MAEPAAAAAAPTAAGPGEAEHLRQITQIPLFYGRPDKDSLTAGMLIERVEAAAEAAGWNNQRKLSAFFLALRDKALIWHKSLKLDRFNLRDWDVVRRQFILDYEPQFTARTHCTNFGELTQRPGETPLNFYGRIVVVMERIEEDRPDHINVVEIEGGHLGSKLEGYVQGLAHVRHLLFVSGLRDEIRVKVMEAHKATIRESLKVATDAELFLKDKKKLATVSAVSKTNPTTEEEGEEEDEDFNEEEIAAINAIRTRQGKPPFKRRFPARRAKGDLKCRYCKKSGHMQRECRSRIRNNGAMVDASGKPFERKVNAASHQDDPVQRTGQVSSVETISETLQTLNW